MSGLRLLFTFLCACLAVGAIGQTSAQEQAVLERDAALLTEPRNGAPVVAQVKQAPSGELITRKGAWVNLAADALSGSPFSFEVRFHAASASSAIIAGHS